MDSVVELIKKYKEIVTGVVAIGVAVISIAGIKDYFATKDEIKVLTCQMDAGRTLLNSKITQADIAKQLTQRLIEKREKEVAGPDDAASIVVLDVEILSLRTQMAAEQTVAINAQALLGQGACEEKVGVK